MPAVSSATRSATEAVVVVEYCGYSGSTTSLRTPSTRSSRRAVRNDGAP